MFEYAVLLAQAMEESGKAGIATFVMRDHEYLVAIIAEGGVLRAETMRFPEQLRSPADVGLTAPKKPPADRVRALEHAIAGLHARTLKPDEVKDERAESLRRVAERKLAKGKDVVLEGIGFSARR